jgi:hypothetical protein
VHFRAENGGISASSQDALDRARGEFVALLDHDDLLAKEALAEIGRAWTAAGLRIRQRGYRTGEFGAWTAYNVRVVLAGPRNAGLRAYNGEVVAPAKWPAVVDESTWQATPAAARHRQALGGCCPGWPCAGCVARRSTPGAARAAACRATAARRPTGTSRAWSWIVREPRRCRRGPVSCPDNPSPLGQPSPPRGRVPDGYVPAEIAVHHGHPVLPGPRRMAGGAGAAGAVRSRLAAAGAAPVPWTAENYVEAPQRDGARGG